MFLVALICFHQTSCMLNWLHITVSQLLSTAVIQLKSLPRGHGSLLGCELWPHSKVMQLNYLLLVFLKDSSTPGIGRRSNLHTSHSEVKHDLFTLIDHIPGCGSLMLITLAELGMCRSSVRPSLFPTSFPGGQTNTLKYLFCSFDWYK